MQSISATASLDDSTATLHLLQHNCACCSNALQAAVDCPVDIAEAPAGKAVICLDLHRHTAWGWEHAGADIACGAARHLQGNVTYA